MKVSSDPPSHRFVWKREWTIFAALALGMRVLYAALGIFIELNGGPTPLGHSTYALISPYLQQDWFSHWFINPWFQWDTLSYMEVSILGYRSNTSSIAYMPLYPILMRAIAPLLGHNHLAAALLISSICFVAALILLYELTLDVFHDSKLAFRVVIAFLVFPTTFFMLAGYTEALFLTFVLGFWIAARRGHWRWSAFLAGLATLTRLQGAILSPILLWMMFARRLPNPAASTISQVKQALKNLALLRLLKPSNVLIAAVPALVALAYQSWLQWAGFGTITEALASHWQIETVLPWTGVQLFFQRLYSIRYIYMDWLDLLLFVIILMLGVRSIFELSLDFSLYIWLTLAILFMRGTPPHLLASYSRYFLALFPIFMLLARLKGKPIQILSAAIALLMQVLLTYVFLIGSWVA